MEPNKSQMFEDEYLYYVHVYEDEEVYKYEFGNIGHAKELYEAELSKGNKADLFRYNVLTGKMEKYKAKPKCNCPQCQPRRIQYHSMERN